MSRENSHRIKMFKAELATISWKTLGIRALGGNDAPLFSCYGETLLHGFERTRLQVILSAYALPSSEVRVLQLNE